ncbi:MULTISPECIES: DUF6708 domain-containing protein [Psychrobacter]|uniref:DUF6708 domain-containing protein n=1 Tax=Psychrobacter TaxID=497 RepID=UPI000C325A8F|nr:MULTISPECIES: DUF6708 domain-containing protein [Psychrobacter]PKG35744.1 hypothetical protein CXF65_05995 [Psychrobacter sp. Sarcosine-3u-12]
MIDINGRNPFAKFTYREVNQKLDKTFGMGLGGRVQELKDFKWLDKKQGYDVPLYPQRTVVQFNSTYMELTGRQDRIRGDVTFGSIFFLTIISIGIYYTTASVLLDISKGNTYAIAYVGVITVLLILMAIYLLALLSTELFTYTYLPIRFNRKTRKVYVRQANRKVEVFDWDELKFYMATTYKDGGDVRGITLADDGMTITGMFSLPFVSDLTAKEILGGTQLKQHFEFVRRYMEGDDKQLEEVKSAVRYVHSVHQKRETPLISFQRVILAALDSDENMEYPKQALKLHWTHSAVIIQLWLRYLGRLLSINTSITPKFSPEIEAECQIDPNDPHDLNKYLPEGNLEDSNQPLWKKLAYSIGLILFGIVMLFAFAFFVDIIGSIRGHYPDVVGKLWYLFSFKWLF